MCVTHLSPLLCPSAPTTRYTSPLFGRSDRFGRGDFGGLGGDRTLESGTWEEERAAPVAAQTKWNRGKNGTNKAEVIFSKPFSRDLRAIFSSISKKWVFFLTFIPGKISRKLGCHIRQLGGTISYLLKMCMSLIFIPRQICRKLGLGGADWGPFPRSPSAVLV